MGLLRDHGAGQVVTGAVLLQPFRVALTPVPEAEIITTDKPRGALTAQLFQKCLPWRGHHFFRHGEAADGLDPIVPQQQLPVMDGGNQRRIAVGKQAHGMIIEGDCRGFAALLRSQRAAAAQKRLMSQMDTVEKAQREDLILVFHNRLPLLSFP